MYRRKKKTSTAQECDISRRLVVDASFFLHFPVADTWRTLDCRYYVRGVSVANPPPRVHRKQYLLRSPSSWPVERRPTVKRERLVVARPCRPSSDTKRAREEPRRQVADVIGQSGRVLQAACFPSKPYVLPQLRRLSESPFTLSRMQHRRSRPGPRSKAFEASFCCSAGHATLAAEEGTYHQWPTVCNPCWNASRLCTLTRTLSLLFSVFSSSHNRQGLR